MSSSGKRGGKASSATGAGGEPKKTVDDVVAGYAEPARQLAGVLRGRVRAAVPGAAETVKWGNPVFEHRGQKLCYLQGHKDYLRFGFFEQGTQLDDPDDLLEGTGKAMRHVKIRSEGEIPPHLDGWLKQAAKINERRAGG